MGDRATQQPEPDAPGGLKATVSVVVVVSPPPIGVRCSASTMPSARSRTVTFSRIARVGRAAYGAAAAS